MGKRFDDISEDLSKWLAAQPVFFVATAPLNGNGSVNCSPKGNRDEFAAVESNKFAYLIRPAAASRPLPIFARTDASC
jgi:predicted pyridoxine 5'-phosphate oxidase superfamily flavin-nucleotide-binding protein